MSRDAFLAKLRARLAVPVHPNLPHPLVAVDGVPRVSYARDLSDPVQAFTHAAEAVGATVLRGRDREQLVRQALAATDARRVVLSRDPECEGLAPLVSVLGLEVVPFDGVASASSADLGITGAAWGIAATGTIVLDAARAGGRSASLLPPAHLAILRASRIVPDSAALFRGQAVREMPSQLVLATGPSRSGDIELVLTIGAHGPGRVVVALLEDMKSA